MHRQLPRQRVLGDLRGDPDIEFAMNGSHLFPNTVQLGSMYIFIELSRVLA